MANLSDYFTQELGSMIYLGEVEVTGAAATSMPSLVVDLSAYRAFRLIIKAENATGSGCNLQLFYNGDTTGTNYWRQVLAVNDLAQNSSRSNDAFISAVRANLLTVVFCDITQGVDGKPRAVCSGNVEGTSGIEQLNYYHRWVTAANVTLLTITSNVASSLGVGSKMTAYGIK